MPSFPKPSFTHKVDVDKELKALKAYRDSKPDIKIPASTKNNLVMATWNIANLGEQDRTVDHLKIIAEMISWFDVVAIQEVKEDVADLETIVAMLGSKYQYIFCDPGGNRERIAFIYRSKIKVLNEIGELSVSPSELEDIKLPGVTDAFMGFDRSPFMVSFMVNDFKFTLLNVHLYFGKENEEASINRRCLEAYAVGRWADLRSKSKKAYVTNVFALGDFNLPKVDLTDPIYKALVKRGLQLPEHTSKVYSNINNDMAYDQIAFLPGMKSKIVRHGVFPFDNAVFADIYNSKTGLQFRSYIRYFISDHRPMWMELNVAGI